jgi:cytochrome c-type biogenesis protein CcmH
MRIFLLSLLLLAATGLHAQNAVPTLDDPLTQKREVELTSKLRCLVCQNQSIADSHAGLAIDLRNQVREQMAAGKTDEQIIKFMTDRYGDFVLYEPPFKATTALLWGGPGLLLLIGAFVAVRYVRGRKRVSSAPLSDEERARADALLAAGESRK